MTDTATATPTVQSLRHEVQNAVREAQNALSVRVYSDVSAEVSSSLGDVDASLKGRSGVSKEEQVEILSAATEKVAAVKKDLKKTFKALAKEYADAVKQAEADATEAVKQAEAKLAETKKVAAERDFDAHQQAKGKGPATVAGSGFHDVDPDEFDEDDV